MGCGGRRSATTNHSTPEEELEWLPVGLGGRADARVRGDGARSHFKARAPDTPHFSLAPPFRAPCFFDRMGARAPQADHMSAPGGMGDRAQTSNHVPGVCWSRGVAKHSLRRWTQNKNQRADAFTHSHQKNMPASTAAALPSWSGALARAIERNTSTPAARYLQLATVRPDGRPTVRSVVFRGLRPGVLHPGSPDPALAIVTDGRTAKVAHLAAHPHAEAAWYFPDTREQFRLGGRVTAVGAMCGEPALAAAREEVWAGLSPGVREWHVCPEPGSVRNRGDRGGEEAGAGPAAEVMGGKGRGGSRPAGSAAPTSTATSTQPHSHFTLLLLDIEAVDHVDLGADTRRVWERQVGGKWIVREVWP